MEVLGISKYNELDIWGVHEDSLHTQAGFETSETRWRVGVIPRASSEHPQHRM